MINRFSKIVLHFGADKTGSTSLQASLNNNRDILLSQYGIAYAPGHVHGQFGSYFCDEPETYIYNTSLGHTDRDLIKQNDAAYMSAFDFWLEHLAQAEVIVLSFEGFVDLPESALRRIVKKFQLISDHVLAILYARPPLSYAVSALSQRAKAGRPMWDPDSLPVCYFGDYLGRIVPSFGRENVIVRPFVRSELYRGDIIADFIHVLDVEDITIDEISQTSVLENVKLTMEAAIFGGVLSGEFEKKGIFISDAEFNNRFGEVMLAVPGTPIHLSANQIDTIMSASAPHTQELKAFDIQFSEKIENFLQPRDYDVSEIQKNFVPVVNFLVAQIMRDLAVGKDILTKNFILLKVEPEGAQRIDNGDRMEFRVIFQTSRDIGSFRVGVHIFDAHNRWAFGANTFTQGLDEPPLAAGTYARTFSLIADLPDGDYAIGFSFADMVTGKEDVIARFEKLKYFSVCAIRDNKSIGYCNLPFALY